MKKKKNDRSISGREDGSDEMLILCRLFGDKITVKLCNLRRRELSGWDTPCPLCESLNKSSLDIPGVANIDQSARKARKPRPNSHEA